MAATPSPNYSDKALLASDPGFQSRVRAAMMVACSAIRNEAAATPAHRERVIFLVSIMNNPDHYMVLFSDIVSTDALVIGDATAAGATPLTAANVATQALLVQDSHLDTAIAANFNSFFSPSF